MAPRTGSGNHVRHGELRQVRGAPAGLGGDTCGGPGRPQNPTSDGEPFELLPVQDREATVAGCVSSGEGGLLPRPAARGTRAGQALPPLFVCRGPLLPQAPEFRSTGAALGVPLADRRGVSPACRPKVERPRRNRVWAPLCSGPSFALF